MLSASKWVSSVGDHVIYSPPSHEKEISVLLGYLDSGTDIIQGVEEGEVQINLGIVDHVTS